MSETKSQELRVPPPPRLRVAIGGFGSMQGGEIFIALSDLREETLFAIAFEKMEWDVLLVTPEEPVELFVATCPNLRELVLTDWLPFLKWLKASDEKHTVMFLADPNQEAIRTANEAGADQIFLRPVDLEDPLGQRK